MFRTILRKINYIRLKKINEQNKQQIKKEKIPKSLEDIKLKFGQTLKDCSDVITRDIITGANKDIMIMIAYIDGLVKKELIDANILNPILHESLLTDVNQDINRNNIIEYFKEKILTLSDLQEIDDYNEAIYKLLCGNVILFIDGNQTALSSDTKAFENRGVEEPDTESVVRGPREGFTETIRVNIALIRRKIKHPNLKFEKLQIGTYTRTDVSLCYIKGLAQEEIVSSVRQKLHDIKIDAILESGNIEEFIEDNPYSIFPTVGNYEKPDIVASKILEGRVAIICDGTPFVLTVPYVLIEALQASEDHYARYIYSSVIRTYRFLAFIITTLAPALYISLICFHQDLIPYRLALAISASRKGVPFTPFIEASLMTLTFELIREAGIRMPKPIGQAISIVGALVLGQAAVEASLVSNLMLIVISITAVTSFIISPLSGTIPILRFAFMIAGNILGLMGVFLVGLAFLIHTSDLTSFGVPYLAPFAPINREGLKDSLIRVPIWAKKNSSDVFQNINPKVINYYANPPRKEDK